MKNQKLTATLRLVKKQQTPVKYIEDLLQEDDIDVCAVLDAKWKNPIKTWFVSKLFNLEIELKEQKQKVKFFFKKLFKKNK
jgi:hypothetical protein